MQTHAWSWRSKARGRECQGRWWLLCPDHMVRLVFQILSYIGKPLNSGGWVKIWHMAWVLKKGRKDTYLVWTERTFQAGEQHVGDSLSFPSDFTYSLVSPSGTMKTSHMVKMGSHCGKLTAITSHLPPSFYGLSHFLIHRSFLFLPLSAAVHISISLLFLWTGL